MRKLVITLGCILFLPLNLYADKAPQKRIQVEMLEGTPSRPYSIISPISADKGSVEKAYAQLRNKAEKMHADAIMEVECEAGQKIRTGLLQLKTLGSSSVCQGTAIKWTTAQTSASTN